ncbi:hypothetical protein K438DRAFT_185199 [Mycena galopus ATCC 62051]|nr:hypothetical protein K438DRAFT_185199 [Mycena galopus ATCC 62051]
MPISKCSSFNHDLGVIWAFLCSLLAFLDPADPLSLRSCLIVDRLFALRLLAYALVPYRNCDVICAPVFLVLSSCIL